MTLGLLMLTGCTAEAWVTHPMPQPPDRSCRTGGGAGHDVWIWECIDQKHVVISKYCAGFTGCHEAQREEVACGKKTALEQDLDLYLGPDCSPPPEGTRWPGT
jgi:hypothetical protein